MYSLRNLRGAFPPRCLPLPPGGAGAHCLETSRNLLLQLLVTSAIPPPPGGSGARRLRSAWIQHQHRLATATAEGAAEAERCLVFLAAVGQSEAAQKQREEAGGSGGGELGVALWRELRRGEGLAAVAGGSAHVYFTPQDAHLTIEGRA